MQVSADVHQATVPDKYRSSQKQSEAASEIVCSTSWLNMTLAEHTLFVNA